MAGAFYDPLQNLEVTLRNALHRELAAHFGRWDWWNMPRLNLHSPAAAKITEARAVLARTRKDETAGRVIAELSFGFWVSLLGKGNDYEMRLWRPALHRAFPGYRGGRRPLYDELDRVRRFRNLIAHHHPIHQRDLADDHARILRLIGWISAPTAAWVRRNDRVRLLLAGRPDAGKEPVPTT